MKARGATLSLARPGRRRNAAFSPLQVPEVVAGYFWDPTAGSGGGGAGFVVPEGNGKSAYNMITPAANAAPTLGTVNGATVVTYANGSPDQLARTSANVQRGWTGATMIAGWFTAAGGSVLGHWRPTANVLIVLGATRIDLHAHDGTANREAQHTISAGWIDSPAYVEAVFDPTQAATNRLQIWVNRVQIAPSVAPSMGAALRDDASLLSFSGTVGDSSTFNIVANFSHGVVYLTNGIPSAAVRDSMFNHRRLA